MAVITVENVSKRFRKGQTGYHTLREDVYNLTGRLIRLRTGGVKGEDKQHILALNNVSFQIEQGEKVGIIGPNGSGKTTLLRLLAGIMKPTEGKIRLKGRLGVLIELMAGFHPELTGRENIYLNGAIMGMSKKEIRRKFDEIVAFAELEDFIDTPIKRYSSGMHIRLGFAVSAHLEPDILLVDEVLAVGDAAFQKKCLGKLEDVAQEGRTVVFVSHNMGSIANLCPRAILLVDGTKHSDGPSDMVISEYISTVAEHPGERIWGNPETAPGNERVRLHAVRVVCDGQVTPSVDIDKDVRIEIEFWNLKAGSQILTSIYLQDKMGVVVLSSANVPSANLVNDEWFGEPHPVGLYRTVCTLPGSFLNEGLYSITASVLTGLMSIEILEREVIFFTVYDSGAARKEFSGLWAGVVRPRLSWQTEYRGPLDGGERESQ